MYIACLCFVVGEIPKSGVRIVDRSRMMTGIISMCCPVEMAQCVTFSVMRVAAEIVVGRVKNWSIVDGQMANNVMKPDNHAANAGIYYFVSLDLFEASEGAHPQ